MATDPLLSSLPEGAYVLIKGASRGIGLGFVRRLLAVPRVTRVYATCRHPEDAEALMALGDRHGGRLCPLPLDVTREDTIARAAVAVEDHTPKLHLLINAAGVLHDGPSLAPEKRLADVTPEALLKSFQVNAWGPILVAKHFAGLLTHGERAVLANISARVGSIGDNRFGGWYAYRAAKSAQNMFTRNLAIELRRRSKAFIAVALHPGTTDTDLSKPFQKRVPDGKLFNVDYAVEAMLGVIDRLGEDDNGCFFAYNGQPIEW
ncbi:MAG: SDR family oxidoreductase [Candidatus Competibacterales bacterium]